MFSKSCEYALRAAIYVAQKSSEAKKMAISEIAKAIDSPQHFTAKILQVLVKGDVISSVKGPNGGFYITAKQKQLPARKVLQALGEDKELEKCVLGLKECSEKNPCPMHVQYKFIRPQIIRLFESKTIEDLAESKESNLKIKKS
ncbi:Rrf2 family transcriptional regulator [Panacibacter ginsenosidivorans]|uniref:Rrf2 family transcriptional regulator n=1 Tax=Panacibacter ginsenosidivorans TaxID=1813871 RepID=A0A5B8VDY2_9BACT|nr:Rrf2 family transcriptional regulator [Panacibacter ginsenosidivorans]QEC69223.1 Rrf2 family transcriptional regulator [Panacibacter ginsenosidivorans]